MLSSYYDIVIHINYWYPWPSDTRGYVIPVISNVLFGRHNSKFSQNNICGSHPKAFISAQIKTILWLNAMVLTNVLRVSEPAVCTLRLSVWVFTPLLDGGEKTQNPGSNILNPWFPKVLEIFENTFLYIIAGFFSSEGRRFLYSPLEKDAIRPSFFPFGRLRCFVEIRFWFVHLTGAKTVVIQPLSQTHRLSELIY